MAAFGAGVAAYCTGSGGLSWKLARVQLASSSRWIVAALRLWR
jgi:S-formylglutathione hydrolase FrmB